MTDEEIEIEAPEPLTLAEWVEELRDESGIDPADVENFCAVLVYEAEDGHQEGARMWAVDGTSAPAMALVAGANSVAGQLSMVVDEMLQPTGGSDAGGLGISSRGFD